MSDDRSSEAREGIARLALALRRQGITDRRVLNAIERVPRDLFVPDEYKTHAFDDTPLPIGCDQTISQPFIVAYMLQEAQLSDRHKVLEVGTGSGYQAAVLAQLCRRVYTIERHKKLLDQAVKRFESLNILNISTRLGDGRLGWPEQGEFDRILVTAGGSEVPEALLKQLKKDGILLMPLTKSPDFQSLVRIHRFEEGTFETEDLLSVRFVPLEHGLAKGET